ncbi:MAG: transcription-repair coupling factor [bacterium]
MVKSIVEILKRSPTIRRAIEQIKSRDEVLFSGLAGSSLAILIGMLFEALKRDVLVICPYEADEMRRDIETVVGEDLVNFFPDWESDFYADLSPNEVTVGTRLKTLGDLISGKAGIIVTSPQAMVRRLIPPNDLRCACLNLDVGQVVDLGKVLERLAEMGYIRIPVVEEKGFFAVRGGIVDVYPPSDDDPIRIEFYGNAIESMRRFDVATQRSKVAIKNAKVLPAREITLDDASIGRFFSHIPAKRKCGIERTLAHIRERFFFEGLEAYAQFFYSSPATLASYVPVGSIVVLVEPDVIISTIKSQIETIQKRYRERKGDEEALPSPETMIDTVGDFDKRLSKQKRISVVSIPTTTAVHLGFRGVEPTGGSLKILNSMLEQSVRQGYRIYILSETQGQARRLEEVITPRSELITIGVGSLKRGFVLDEAHLKVITEVDIFGDFIRRPRHVRFKGGIVLETYRDLNVGDYVVHVNHGIGRFGGIERLIVDGTETECILIHYQGGDKIYVPVDQLDLVQKYIGKDGEPPTLSRLGGLGWERVKARTKKAIKKMAEELIRIYAIRKARPGYAFRPDTLWQKQLEASFMWDDTPDQIRVTEEIKSDMESEKPMDRLVCGDVGYGKTEVAIRAAFKAVLDGKQVAVLVPTTVLAQQHFYTFRERLAEFPIVIEMLSRFRTRGEQKRIIQGLRNGTVDIVIGTHRLLQRDVEFKDLGLVIIDEEQRFGVAHKEAFKRLRTTVDVLTLTATPIPRTLHMALLGARDMSIIDTPPPDRLPVETHVLPFDEDVIVNAVMRELDRAGQVYFVHNRVETIDTVARHIASLLPQARIAVAHGKMSERELERVMLDFVSRKYDILVSTMIVESGLDIPNVNTIIVNRADTFGLAQLYQLRGRVGRSRQKAYAYLLVPKKKHLTEEQRKRLKALLEFTQLGSGFRIAMRDLEIRGAGNILGPEQSGYIAEVGFDLYCKLLDEAIKEIRGEPIEPRVETRVETDLPAFLPETYVDDSKQRVIFYKRLVELRKPDEIDQLEAEIMDRYGALPPAGSYLFEFQRLRLLAISAGVTRIVIKKDKLGFEMSSLPKHSLDRVKQSLPRSFDLRLSVGQKAFVEIKPVPARHSQTIDLARKVLIALAQV